MPEKYKDILKSYSSLKMKILSRLKEFSLFLTKNDDAVFEELCFCILTPQSKAVYADMAIKSMHEKQILYKGSEAIIRKHLQKVRFPNNKTKYLLHARQRFMKNGKIKIKDIIDPTDIHATREEIVRNVKGIGLKEASHFLRNIGYGKNIAILDVHILNNLKKYDVIASIPKTISRKQYYDIEKKMKSFSLDIGIPMDQIDLLFWAIQTGHVFK
ncbi:MAG: N-glycosylase/DNA lyase [Candidatus Omnitrophica bacterium]|nr:N-glycosylase/DNA lyase [Candidatus Omnitrophota bacterium]